MMTAKRIVTRFQVLAHTHFVKLNIVPVLTWILFYAIGVFIENEIQFRFWDWKRISMASAFSNPNVDISRIGILHVWDVVMCSLKCVCIVCVCVYSIRDIISTEYMIKAFFYSTVCSIYQQRHTSTATMFKFSGEWFSIVTILFILPLRIINLPILPTWLCQYFLIFPILHCLNSI